MLVGGDVVHILLPNSSQYYFPVFGTWILQGLVSPADPGLSPEVLARQLEDAGTKVIFCCVNALERVKYAREVLKNLIPIVGVGGMESHFRVSDLLKQNIYFEIGKTQNLFT